MSPTPLDHLFSTTLLSLLIPDTSLPFPPPASAPIDAWLAQAQREGVERREAFFDEQLLSFLVLRIEHPADESLPPNSSPPNSPSPSSTPQPPQPPQSLLHLLQHIQISLEASYISPTPAPQSFPPDAPRTSRLLNLPNTPRTSLGPSSLAPPRTGGSAGGQAGRLHPSILPPSTPNPMPSTGDQDRKYVAAEGTILVANIWGAGGAVGSTGASSTSARAGAAKGEGDKADTGDKADKADDPPEAFGLFWSEENKDWVAVYRMGVTVSFLRLPYPNPLLCLTVSATLREKPIPTHPGHPLARYFASLGGGGGYASPETPKDPSANVLHKEEEEVKLLDGLEEVNLLGGLLESTTFAKLGPQELNVPSLRLGTVSRQKLFSLPPVLVDTPVQPSPSPMTAVRKAHPTLRKSYRKTLRTVSGFRVRMRTVFVPYVLLPEDEPEAHAQENGGGGGEEDEEERERERERREAGSEERTVVLCVEIENSGDSGVSNAGLGFMLERVDVSIGGEGARATLISWGDAGFSPSSQKEKKPFPLLIGPLAQYNLLYAVRFMRSPEEVEVGGFSFARKAGEGVLPELQRAVTINIFGKPYFPRLDPSAGPGSAASALAAPLLALSSHLAVDVQKLDLRLPTRTFSSRWNCVLDLTAQQPHLSDVPDATDAPSVLPEPASPFPGFAVYTPNTQGAYTQGGGTPNVTFGGTGGTGSGTATPLYSATAGSKRFTVAPGVGSTFSGRTLKNLTPNRAAHSPRPDLPPIPMPMPSSRPTSLLPSNPASAAQYLRSPTTYAAPPPPPLSFSQIPPPVPIQMLDDDALHAPLQGVADMPITPAYPSFPSKSALPPTPTSQAPLAFSSLGQGGNVGPSVEIKRERGAAGPGALGGGGGGGIQGEPQTPLPTVGGAFGEQRMLEGLRGAGRGGESVVVSVGLMPFPVSPASSAEGKDGDAPLGPGKIYPLDVFTLDIFVFNQSTWVRRFEVTCPDRRRGRRRRGGGGGGAGSVGGGATGSEVASKMGYPGVLPLESRVRIGPLRPSACQSVRMKFVAVSPGVHAIETLALTDVDSGVVVNLRSVLDVVVHDPND